MLSFLEPNNLRLCDKEFLLTTLSNKLFMVTIVSYQTCLMNFDKDLKEKEQKNQILCAKPQIRVQF